MLCIRLKGIFTSICHSLGMRVVCVVMLMCSSVLPRSVLPHLQPRIYSVRSHVHTFANAYIFSQTCMQADWKTEYPLTHSRTPTLTHSIAHVLVHALTHLNTYSVTRSQSCSHSLTSRKRNDYIII